MLQIKEKVSSKPLILGQVWPFLEPKGKYEWNETSAEARLFRWDLLAMVSYLDLF